MPNDNAIKFGILKTRDLVELYYGARMVATIAETEPGGLVNVQNKLLGADPRRIKYEIILGNLGPVTHAIQIGSPSAVAGGDNQIYVIPPGGTIIIERGFRADMETVCGPLDMIFDNNDVQISVRETFLTPIPVDEMP